MEDHGKKLSVGPRSAPFGATTKIKYELSYSWCPPLPLFLPVRPAYPFPLISLIPSEELVKEEAAGLVGWF